jgi:ATP synthase (C/AC39) subunit
MRIVRGYSFENCSCFNLAILIYVVFLFPDFRTQLSATDYGNFLANEPLPISTSTISDKATQILVEQFNYLRNNAVQPLAKFLEYITSGFFSLTQP